MYICTGAMWHVIHWKMCGQLKMLCYAPQQNVVVLKYVTHSAWSVYKGSTRLQGWKKGGMLCVHLSSLKASCTRNVYTHAVYCNTYIESQHVPHSMGYMRPQTIVKAGIGWTGSAVTLSSLLNSLATSPTSQPPCFLSVSIFVQPTSSSCYHIWRFGAMH